MQNLIKEKTQLEKLVSQAEFVTSDSREVKAGGIFVALTGENEDGRKYLDQALQAGANAVLTWGEADSKLSSKIFSSGNSYEEHFENYRHLLKLLRKKFKTPLIAVVGSNGKTSTQNFLFQSLSQKYSVVHTQGSQNGTLGIPKTLEQIRERTDYAVVEIGIDAPGEMKKHVELVEPNYVLLTSLGLEHVEKLKNIETIIQEETSILEWVEKTHSREHVFVNSMNELIEDYNKLKNFPELKLLDDRIKKDFPDFPDFQQMNLSLVKGFLRKLDPSLKILPEMIQFDQRRGRLLQRDESYYFLDYYNANPSSMPLAVEHSFREAQKKKLPFYAILGDMGELGALEDFLHLELVQYVAQLTAENNGTFFFVGSIFSKNKNKILKLLPKARFYSKSSSEELFQELERLPKAAFYLFKGSRFIKLEKIVERIIR